MKLGFLSAAVLLLAGGLAAGCRPETGVPVTYEAWEEGRTLIFENPSLSDAPPARRRYQERFQKQVVRTTESGAGRKVETVFTTFQGQQKLDLVMKAGGVSLLDSLGRPVTILPEGFPEQSSSWQSPGYRMRVIGRARWEREQPSFPVTHPPEGVWVEGEPMLGAVRIRVFYLPDFGEVEKRELRDGKWVTTNLLVGWSFQEIPRAKGQE